MNDQLHDELALWQLKEMPTMLDRFAMAAMPFMTPTLYGTYEMSARECYKYAKAMMKEKESLDETTT